MANLSVLKTTMAKTIAGLTVLSFLVLAQTPSKASLLHLEPIHAADLVAAVAVGDMAGGLALWVKVTLRSEPHLSESGARA